VADIFSADEIAADQTGADGEVQQPQERQDVPARDVTGKFVAKPPAKDEAAADGTADGSGQGEAEGEAGKPGTVPQGALHAEREKRKASEAQARQYKEQLDAIAQMRAQIANRQPAEQQQPGDDEASQVAYLKQRLEQIEGTQNGLVQRQQAEYVDQAERQHLAIALSSSEAEFRASKPDYDAAVSHVVNARAQELRLYGLNDVQVQQMLQQEVMDITRAAIEQQRSPAEVAYQLATLRGYRPATGQDGQQQAQQPQGAAAAQIDAITAARAGSRSLGQAAGAAPPKDLNAQTIAAMTDDEFQALYSTPEGRRMIDAL
jgi:hypothetical protein